MCAVYAFMRECDDRSDGPEAALARVLEWRSDLAAALALARPIIRYGRRSSTRRALPDPEAYFQEMLDGVASDFEPRTIGTFDDLYRYCYRVASVVGLTIIHIFGFEEPRALELAENAASRFS